MQSMTALSTRRNDTLMRISIDSKRIKLLGLAYRRGTQLESIKAEELQ